MAQKRRSRFKQDDRARLFCSWIGLDCRRRLQEISWPNLQRNPSSCWQEILHRVSEQTRSGAAHVAVYWSYYGNATFEIISSKYLSSFYESDNQELIPPHAGKHSNITLQSKSNSYYFHRLPYISRKEYNDLIATCSYNPSFLVRENLNRYQGIGRTQTSRVFPPDDTDMCKNISRKHDWKKPNNFIEKVRVEFVVDKLMNCLRSR